MRDILLIVIVGVCSLVALRRPVFGMLVFVSLGFLNPHSMTWGVARTFPLSQLVAASTIIGYVFWSEPKRLPLQRESILLSALWGIFAMSSLLAISPDVAGERLIHISKIFLMVFLATCLINTEHRLHVMLRVIALSLGFYGLKGGIFAISTGGEYLVLGPEESFLFSNNSIGLALAMNVPLLLYLWKIETRQWLRWVIVAMLVFSYPAVIFTYSRGAWLGLAIVTMLSVLKSRRRFVILAVGGFVGLVFLQILLQTVPERLTARYEALLNYREESSADSRFWNWEFCRRVGLAHPLHGGGFDFYSPELYQKYYPEFIEQWGPDKVWSCHSVWFTLLAEHGLPGFILWIGLLGSLFMSLRQLRSSGGARPEFSWVRGMADMLQMAFMAYMVVGTFLDAAYFDMFYYLVAVLIILKERLSHRVDESLSPADPGRMRVPALGAQKPPVKA